MGSRDRGVNVGVTRNIHNSWGHSSRGVPELIQTQVFCFCVAEVLLGGIAYESVLQCSGWCQNFRETATGDRGEPGVANGGKSYSMV